MQEDNKHEWVGPVFLAIIIALLIAYGASERAKRESRESKARVEMVTKLKARENRKKRLHDMVVNFSSEVKGVCNLVDDVAIQISLVENVKAVRSLVGMVDRLMMRLEAFQEMADSLDGLADKVMEDESLGGVKDWKGPVGLFSLATGNVRQSVEDLKESVQEIQNGIQEARTLVDVMGIMGDLYWLGWRVKQVRIQADRVVKLYDKIDEIPDCDWVSERP